MRSGNGWHVAEILMNWRHEEILIVITVPSEFQIDGRRPFSGALQLGLFKAKAIWCK